MKKFETEEISEELFKKIKKGSKIILFYEASKKSKNAIITKFLDFYILKNGD